jgi:hypothetical protein
MKIAYIIAAHKNPAQLARMIDRLDDEDNSFFIHINKKEEAMYQASHERLAGRENVFFITRIPLLWAHFGLVRALIVGIQTVRESGLDVDYAVSMSGQDYPIKPRAVIKQRLAGYDGRTIMEHFPLSVKAQNDSSWLFRFERYFFWFLGKSRSYPPSGMSWLPHKKREVPHGLTPYGGSIWWCFNRETMDYVSEYLDTQAGQDMLRFFQHTWGAGELFFQTILMNSPLADGIVNEDLWEIEWPTGLSSPITFTGEHFERLRDSDKLFARKFDEGIDAGILDRIDKEILRSREGAQ